MIWVHLNWNREKLLIHLLTGTAIRGWICGSLAQRLPRIWQICWKTSFVAIPSPLCHSLFTCLRMVSNTVNYITRRITHSINVLESLQIVSRFRHFCTFGFLFPVSDKKLLKTVSTLEIENESRYEVLNTNDTSNHKELSLPFISLFLKIFQQLSGKPMNHCVCT